MHLRRPYLVAMSVAGVCILGAGVGMLAAVGITLLGLLLLILTILARWLRVDLDPSGHIDLAPFLLFVTLLLAGPSVALFSAGLSALINSRIFLRNPWWDVAAETGEQTTTALAAVIAGISTGLAADALYSWRGLLALFVTVVVYGGVGLMLAALRSNFAEGIGMSSFVRGAGGYMAIHLIVLSSAALGLVSVYDRVGYLALPLATIAVVEFYYPAKLIGEQRNALFASLAMIAQAIDLKDSYTAAHLHNVETIAVRTARAMRLPETEVRRIRFGAVLHDIGKVGVSGKIIRKPAELDPAEMSMMRQHPVIGGEIMQPVELLSEAAEIVRHHHEHYDGSGYPDGLKGENIPIGSRIVLVADAFHAMTSDRPYRRARSRDEALRVLREGAVKQFDPKVVRAFESVIDLI